jgi:NADPH:quinone reductase-like Zn-dependent oxidoreductase
MRAVVVERRGDPGTLRDVPTPVAGNGELLVRIRAAGVNPIDWKARDAGYREIPYVLGQDFAGVVDAVGTGVTAFSRGDRVAGIARVHGTFADFTTTRVDEPHQPVAPIPSGVSDVVAAALPTAGLTALSCVERLEVGTGQTFFIVGVTGTVGRVAAQIARSRGARVAGSGSAAGGETVKALGLDAFVVFDREDVVAAARARYPAGVDVLLDLADDAAGLRKMAAIVRDGGRIGSTVHSADGFVSERGITATDIDLFGSPQDSRDGLDRLLAMVADGTVKVKIAAERPLDQAVEALATQKSGKLNGKIVLTV